ncbi:MULTISPECIES: hypothetical protein [Actinomycetes]|uniref:Tetratricopeptide repeat protein n=2 Tax=Actinomycetes TaxID=1760 RepID=A0ABP6M8S7_9MICC
MNSRYDDRRGPRRSRPDRPEERSAGASRSRGDLRRSNREDRSRSPEIDEDVTGKELDREAASQLGTLNDTNRTWVAKHLVMAGRLIDVDPALAQQHALAASRRGGRLAVVREAVALTAYAAGDFSEALRELRTYRRISGDQTHLPVQADCERGLGRPQKAVELGESPEAQRLTGAVRAELAIVVAGAHTDLGDHASAVTALEVPELQRDRAFSFSPRLFTVYADALEAVGRGEEAEQWRRQAFVAERALGAGAFESPEIMDFDDEPAELPKVKDVMGGAPRPRAGEDQG